MASEVDICNLALAMLGDKAAVVSISPPDRSVQAELCARFYPGARDALLEAHDWGFARASAPGALLSEVDGVYTYAYPADCLVVRTVTAAGVPSAEFETSSKPGARVVVTPLRGASVIYTRQLADPTKFTPLFVDALAVSLASRLAGPMIQGREGRSVASDLLVQFVKHALPAAINADSGSRMGTATHIPPWMADR